MTAAAAVSRTGSFQAVLPAAPCCQPPARGVNFKVVFEMFLKLGSGHGVQEQRKLAEIASQATAATGRFCLGLGDASSVELS